MTKHLFLTGPSGCGKSTLIKELIGDRLAYAGGFITVRKLNAEGVLQGFDLYPAAASVDITSYSGLRFLDYTKAPPKNDNEIFRNQAVSLLAEAEYYPFALLDEFGGFELLIPQFRNALAQLLSSELPIIGVLKGIPNADSLKHSLGLGDRYIALLEHLHSVLRNDEGTTVIDVQKRGDENAARAIRTWAEEYVTIK